MRRRKPEPAGRLMPPRLRLRSEAKRRRNPIVRAFGDLDQALLRFLRTRGHQPPVEGVMKVLGTAGEWGAVWLAIGLCAAGADRARRGRWLVAACVAPAAIGVNYGVKVAVGRERPLIEGHPPLARAPSKLSFPSAHATSSLAAATAMSRVAPPARPALLALAGGICASRPYLGMHYPSDVLAGAALGTVIGLLAPGVREAGVEERLIDLVVSRGDEAAAGLGADGAGSSSRTPASP